MRPCSRAYSLQNYKRWGDRTRGSARRRKPRRELRVEHREALAAQLKERRHRARYECAARAHGLFERRALSQLQLRLLRSAASLTGT